MHYFSIFRLVNSLIIFTILLCCPTDGALKKKNVENDVIKVHLSLDDVQKLLSTMVNYGYELENNWAVDRAHNKRIIGKKWGKLRTGRFCRVFYNTDNHALMLMMARKMGGNENGNDDKFNGMEEKMAAHPSLYYVLSEPKLMDFYGHIDGYLAAHNIQRKSIDLKEGSEEQTKTEAVIKVHKEQTKNCVRDMLMVRAYFRLAINALKKLKNAKNHQHKIREVMPDETAWNLYMAKDEREEHLEKEAEKMRKKMVEKTANLVELFDGRQSSRMKKWQHECRANPDAKSCFDFFSGIMKETIELIDRWFLLAPRKKAAAFGCNLEACPAGDGSKIKGSDELVRVEKNVNSGIFAHLTNNIELEIDE